MPRFRSCQTRVSSSLVKICIVALTFFLKYIHVWEGKKWNCKNRKKSQSWFPYSNKFFSQQKGHMKSCLADTCLDLSRLLNDKQPTSIDWARSLVRIERNPWSVFTQAIETFPNTINDGILSFAAVGLFSEVNYSENVTVCAVALRHLSSDLPNYSCSQNPYRLLIRMY